MNELCKMSGLKLAEMIVKREVSSLEVVEAHIARIREVNPKINAVVEDRFALARAEARDADRLVRKTHPTNLPPYTGVPFTVKEAIALKGMPFTSGVVARRGVYAKEDAPVVRRLREAGAIPLGSTNCSELCMWMESHNKVYGRTKNPYDPSRISGGSSGGEGAIIGAGGSPFGLGADFGGSIRMPAFFNGIFGHKPTPGLVPNTLNYPIADGDSATMMVTGPLCRKAEDLWQILRIISGPDGKDENCVRTLRGDPNHVDFKKLKAFVIETNHIFEPSAEMKKVLWDAAKHLGDLGAQVEAFDCKEFVNTGFMWIAAVSAGAKTTYSMLMGQGKEINLLVESVKFFLGLSPYTLPSLGLALMERAGKGADGWKQKWVEKGTTLREELTKKLGDDGIILFPPYPETAPLHNMPIVPPFKWLYTAIFNVLRFPATAVPMGLSEQGLPLGVQVAASTGNDHLCIAVAQEIERRFGGWVPPPF
jgi:fatty acid amide hydrolase 2